MLQARELAHPVRLVRGMFYGWWLAVVGAVIMVIGTVPLFQALSLWMPILQQNFGWTTTQLSWAFTLTRVEGTVMGPIAGWGVDKLGPRKMVVIGLLIFAAGFILFSRTANLWMFYLSFVVVSLGAGLGVVAAGQHRAEQLVPRNAAPRRCRYRCWASDWAAW